MDKIVNPKQVYTYDQMVHDIKELKNRYKGIQIEVIGKSVDSRNIYAIKLGDGDKEVMLNGAHHAREWLTSALLMDMLEYYCSKSNSNSKMQELWNQVAIWIVPMVNPDGVTLVQKGPDNHHLERSIQEMNQQSTNYASWKANIRGVDLNRQYPIDWDDINDQVKKPAPAMYKGPKPLSEPESKALYQFSLQHSFQSVACYHSSGNEIFWKYKIKEPLLSEALALSEKLSTLTGYQLIEPGHNPSGGGFTDWFLMTEKRPSFTIEIAPYIGPNPVPLSYYDQIWEENKEVGIFLAKACLNN
ncbi:M14 family metallocarboxypeptidase [Gracilibacillus sp. YIM 98692]|uniref:M14 family metallopeptidase n=1 Tax=Gracilibacillus sp. YIM 98692 TaxID=2663532 RepID=UPI0013D4CF0A|nr:M14 family metallocarboxypeptidase [Gracilibacillus sp. YIM 98692]